MGTVATGSAGRVWEDTGSGQRWHTCNMNRDQTPEYAPAFGWAYSTLGHNTARSNVHFFHGNKRFTPSLCRRFSYQGQDMVTTPTATKCPKCLAAGQLLKVFV